MAQELVQAPTWANGRDVDTWAKRVVAQDAARATPRQGLGPSVSIDSIEHACRQMVREKLASASAAQPRMIPAPFAQTTRSPNSAPPSRSTTTETSVTTAMDVKIPESAATEAVTAPDATIAAALQEACVALGYDIDHDARTRLARTLETCDGGGVLADDILEYVRTKTRATLVEINRAVRPQVPAVLHSVRAKIAYEERRLQELALQSRG